MKTATRLDTLISRNSLVKKASETAQHLYRGKRRKNGDPYFYHPRAVAQIVADWELGEAAVAAAFLHSVIERELLTHDEIVRDFNAEVALLVQGVTNIKGTSYQGLHKDPELFRKFVLQMGRDVRAMLIQLAGRLDNLKILYLQPAERQKQIAFDTLEIHAPLAYRLGMYRLGGELEDLAFPYLYPKEYKWMLNQLKDHYESREQYTERLKTLIEESLKAHGLKPMAVQSRAKRYSSLYKKLLKNDMQLEKVHDLIAIRVIVPQVDDCYRALEVINRYWPPHPEGFADYIAHPKPNGYRSLHATIYGPQQRITEIQIRTQEMHQEAEQGMAARFAYERFKESPHYALRNKAVGVDESVSWVRRLLNWRANPAQNSQLDLFAGHILVITPKQDLIELPSYATALDFAYKIHTNVGNYALKAIINGVEKPVYAALAFGDIVEIVIDKRVWPKWKWITFANTDLAKQKIKDALNKNARADQPLRPASNAAQFTRQLKIAHANEHGTLQRVFALCARSGVSLANVKMHTTGLIAKSPTISATATFTSPTQAEELLRSLQSLPGVTKVF